MIMAIFISIQMRYKICLPVLFWAFSVWKEAKIKSLEKVATTCQSDCQLTFP